MSDQVITLRIRADGTAAVAGIKKVESELGDVGRTGADSGRKAAKGLRNIESGADRAGRSINKAKSYLVAFIGAAALVQTARGVIRMADEYSNLASRIKLVTKSQEEQRRVQTALARVAMETRSGLQSTGDLYVKLTQSTKEMNLSQQQLLRMTETINKSFVVSGASANEANAAIIQFGQGLASGTLRGDEFNSVAEQAPILMDLLAKSLGVTRGELRGMAADGKLTAEVLVNALGEGAADVDEKFGKMQVTVEGAWENVKTAVGRFVGEASSATGASADLADMVLSIADAIDQLADTVGPTIGALASHFNDGRDAATDANAATAQYSATMYNLGLTIVVTHETLRTFFTMIYAGIDIVISLGVAVGKTVAALAQLATAQQEMQRGDFGAALTSYAKAGTIIDDLGNTWSTFGRKASTAIQIVKDTGADADAAIQKYKDDYTKGMEDMKNGTEALAGGVQRLPTLTVHAGKSLKDMGDHGKDAAAKLKAAARVVADFQKQLEEARLRAEGLSQADADYVLTIRDLQDEYQRWIAAGVDAADAQEVLNARVNDAVEGYKKAKTGAKAYREELPKVSREVDAMSQIVDRSAQSMADAFAGWMTGTLSKGKSFARQMVDLVKQMVAQMVAQWAKMRIFGPLLSSIFGSGNVYAGGGYGNVASYASLAAGGGGGGGGLLGGLFGGGTGGGGFLSSIYGAAVNNFGGSGSVLSGQSWMGFGKQLWSGFSDGLSTWTNRLGSLFGLGGASLAGAYGGTTALLAGGYGGVSLAAYNAAPLAASYVGPAAYGGYAASTAAGASGASSAAAGTAAAGVSWIPIIGWIIAGVLKNMEMYQKGYQANLDVNKNLYQPGKLASIGAVDPAGITALTTDKLLHKLGMNDFMSSLFSASSLAVGIWGHAKPHGIAGGIDAQFGPNGVSGNQYVDWKSSGGWFSNAKYGTKTEALNDDLKTQLQDLWDSILDHLSTAADSLGGKAAEALGNFTAGIKSVTKGKGDKQTTEYIVSMLGRTWSEATQEAAVSRIGAEGLIQVIDSWLSDGAKEAAAKPADDSVRAIGDFIEGRIKHATDLIDPNFGPGGGPTSGPSSIAGEASQIAERWRDDAEKLAAGAQFLLGAVTDMQRGTALLADTGPGSLTAITDLVTQLAQQDEALVDTYQRLKAETETYKNLLQLSGVTTGKTGEELVRFADAMANAAGGMQHLQQISQAFTQAYYDQGTQLVAQIDAMRQQVTGQLGALGLDAATSMDQFRAAYEAALPTLSPQDVLQWMQAGLALAQLNQAMDQLAAQQGKYEAFMEGIYQTIGAAFDQPWTRQFAQLDEELHGMIAQANALARAAGKAGASEKDLAAIHEYMAQKAAAMIAALNQDMLSVATQLYGGAGGQTLDQLNAQIAALQASAGHAAGGIKQAAASIDNTASLLIGDLSPYSDRQKLEIAKQQYLSGKASEEDVLRIGQRLMASGADYKQLFDWVMANKRQQVPGAGGFGGSGAGQNNAAQLAELIKQRDALQEQQRFGQAQQLASDIAQMSKVTGDSFADIAAEIRKTNENFSLDKLAKDLGITDIDAYLTKLQEQDLPGNLGSMTDTLVETLHELGANLISAILGHPINPAAIAPITDDGSGAVPIPAGSAPGGTATLSPMPVSLRQDQPLKTDPDLLNKVQELSDRTDAQAKALSALLAEIRDHTRETADATNESVRLERDAQNSQTQPRTTKGIPAL